MVIEKPEKISKRDGRGGSRAKSGRKKSIPNRKTREIADKAYEQGVTPLEVMLNTMRMLVESANHQDDLSIKIPIMISACGIAKDAAPYIHPRLSAVEVKGEFSMDVIMQKKLDDLTEEEILCVIPHSK